MRLRFLVSILLVESAVLSAQAPAQYPAPPMQVWTWEQVRDRFEQNNTTLLAAKLNIDELKAQ